MFLLYGVGAKILAQKRVQNKLNADQLSLEEFFEIKIEDEEDTDENEVINRADEEPIEQEIENIEPEDEETKNNTYYLNDEQLKKTKDSAIFLAVSTRGIVSAASVYLLLDMVAHGNAASHIILKAIPSLLAGYAAIKLNNNFLASTNEPSDESRQDGTLTLQEEAGLLICAALATAPILYAQLHSFEGLFADIAFIAIDAVLLAADYLNMKNRLLDSLGSLKDPKDPTAMKIKLLCALAGILRVVVMLPMVMTLSGPVFAVVFTSTVIGILYQASNLLSTGIAMHATLDTSDPDITNDEQTQDDSPEKQDMLSEGERDEDPINSQENTEYELLDEDKTNQSIQEQIYTSVEDAVNYVKSGKDTICNNVYSLYSRVSDTMNSFRSENEKTSDHYDDSDDTIEFFITPEGPAVT